MTTQALPAPGGRPPNHYRQMLHLRGDEDHPVDLVVARRLRDRVARKKLARLEREIARRLEDKQPVLELEALRNEIIADRDESFFDVGYEHGLADALARARGGSLRLSSEVRQFVACTAAGDRSKLQAWTWPWLGGGDRRVGRAVDHDAWTNLQGTGVLWRDHHIRWRGGENGLGRGELAANDLTPYNHSVYTDLLPCCSPRSLRSTHGTWRQHEIAPEPHLCSQHLPPSYPYPYYRICRSGEILGALPRNNALLPSSPPGEN